MLVDNSAQRNEKIHKMCRNDLRAFALRNYSEGFKTNKPLSGLLLYLVNKPLPAAGISADNVRG